jgi:hypothetical protein
MENGKPAHKLEYGEAEMSPYRWFVPGERVSLIDDPWRLGHCGGGAKLIKAGETLFKHTSIELGFLRRCYCAAFAKSILVY